MLPLLVGRLRTEHPDLEINAFESDHDHELDERLSSGELDLSFLVGEPPPGFEARHLVADPFVLIARRSVTPAPSLVGTVSTILIGVVIGRTLVRTSRTR